MNEQSVTSVEAEPYAKMLYEPLNALLILHGGRIDVHFATWLYVFPAGTTRAEK